MRTSKERTKYDEPSNPCTTQKYSIFRTLIYKHAQVCNMWTVSKSAYTFF